MMRLTLIVAILGSSFLSAGCGAGREYNASVSSWLGAPLEELVSSWGPPDQTMTGAAGGVEYVWFRDTGPHWVEPQAYNPPAQYQGESDYDYFQRRHDYDHSFDPGGRHSTITCRTTVKADARNRVAKISPESFLGLTDCRFVKAPPSRTAGP